jgi:hypothetical protein
MKRSRASAARTEWEIAKELRQIALAGARLNDQQLGLSVRQGQNLMEASDYIRAAGGIEQWLAKHGIDFGISGKSRASVANLLMLGRAGLKACQDAVEFVGKHPERLRTTRRQGIDYFVAALRAFNKRDQPLRTTHKRKKKADRERVLLRRVQWQDDLLYRAMADLEKAVANGWRDNVFKALKSELENAWMLDATDSATDAVSVSEGRTARADHHSFLVTKRRQGASERTQGRTSQRSRMHSGKSAANVPAREARR